MEKRLKAQAGFTLIEIIIVIIIIGFLAALALPRFLNTVEYSRATEAVNYLGTVKRAMDACSVQNNGSFVNCTSVPGIGIDDLSTSPGAHFGTPTFANSGGTGVPSSTGYRITLTRNSSEGGDSVSTVYLDYSNGTVTRGGTSKFTAVK